ncbi:MULTISPECIES: type II toxin-antitoxin system VapC family toxin [unclassified Luteococcus]|uniref:type II toxin-antitoxin system VapC family toxin n=1 Tax=unclassified Luteococcus TaxID=2639923 RepID=UPI00313B1043
MPDPTSVGLLDTSAVIDLDLLDRNVLPDDVAIAAITLAELSAGPARAATQDERVRRQLRLQQVESPFEPIPFGVPEARAYARVHAAALASGRQPRRRFADLLIASTALANSLALVTRNPDDFRGLEDLVDVITV